MTTYAFETQNLTQRFGRKLALDGLTLAIERGGVHAIVGSNGAGKSTLFRTLLGFQTPTAGSCRVLGCASEALDPATRGRIALVHEEHTLPGWMRLDRLVSLHRALHVEWSEATYREVVGHFRLHDEQRVEQLSRGERAGLNLALALAQGPELLLLDEPTLGLDVVAKQAFLEALLFIGQQASRTIVYCSHQMDEIERIADNLVVLEQGRLLAMSSPVDFCQRIQSWLVHFGTEPLDPSTLPGVLTARPIDEMVQLFVLDQGEDFAEILRGFGAHQIHSTPVGLDRAVNAFLTRDHAAPSANGASDHV